MNEEARKRKEEKLREYNNLKKNMNDIIDSVREDINDRKVTNSTISALTRLDGYRVRFNTLNNDLNKKSSYYELDEREILIIKSDKAAYSATILDIKKQLVVIYNEMLFNLNNRVNVIKKEINKLLDNDARKAQANLKLLNLVIPSVYTGDINDTQVGLKLDFDAVNKALSEVSAIEKLLNIKLTDKIKEELVYIDTIIITNISRQFDKENLNPNAVRVDIDNCRDRLDYILKYEKIDDDSKKKIEDLKKKLDELETKLKAKKAGSYKSKNPEYNAAKAKIDTLIKEMEKYYLSIQNLGELSDSKRAEIDAKYKQYEKEIEKYSKEFKDNFENKNKQYYDTLTRRIGKANEFLGKIDKVRKSPRAYTSSNCYDLLNKDIDDIFSNISEIEVKLSEYNKVIKHADRGYFDKKIDKINVDIFNVEQMLKLNKDRDPEKDKAIRERIVQAKEALNVQTKAYHKKCPWGIKQTKSAGNLFKRYNKKVLIGSAIACAALVNTTVGPILIPAIIFGNVLLAYKYPMLNSISDILAKSIGATKDKDGKWVLPNGTILTPLKTVAALLKAIAVAGLKIPLKLGKALIERVKQIANMTPSEEYIENMKKARDKQTNKYNNREEDKLNVKITKLYNKYRNGLYDSFEVFCEQEKLSDEVIEKLRAYTEFKEDEERRRGSR